MRRLVDELAESKLNTVRSGHRLSSKSTLRHIIVCDGFSSIINDYLIHQNLCEVSIPNDLDNPTTRKCCQIFSLV